MKQKKVTQLDENGYFLGTAIAYESPLEPGVFHIPAGALDIQPPVIPAGKRARWLNGKWVFSTLPLPTAPEGPQSMAPQFKSLSVVNFLDLFTQEEELAIIEAGRTNSLIESLRTRILVAPEITLDYLSKRRTLESYVEAELLTEGRKAAIMEALT